LLFYRTRRQAGKQWVKRQKKGKLWVERIISFAFYDW
jgi:hypothetical protein